MGYYNIFDLFENIHWREHSRREGSELVMDKDHTLVCPHCLKPFSRAPLLSEESLLCPHCRAKILLTEAGAEPQTDQ